MLFKTMGELISYAEGNNLKLSDVMLLQESQVMDRSKEDIFKEMSKHLDVMEESVKKGLNNNSRSHSGLTGGDAKKIREYKDSGKVTLSDNTILDAVASATATSEINASMGTIVATPTAGSCGILPGTIFTIAKKLNSSREDMVRALFVAGAVGFVIANNSFISGATGGCQAEVGSATAMASAALVELAQGTPSQSGEAVSIALKNMLGLVCDPIAGLVEAPCVKRNAMGSAIALVSADMALAGVKSVVPTDEVIEAMHKIGQLMPVSLKETSMAGLAATPTGKRLEKEIFGVKQV